MILKSIYNSELEKVDQLENNSEKLTYLTSILRSLLQTVVVTTFEIVKEKTPYEETNFLDYLERFCRPPDGLPVEIIENLVPFLRRNIDKQFLSGWFEKTKNNKTPLSTQLSEWVQFRNNRQGHGVIDQTIRDEWAERTKTIIKNALAIFEPIIPVLNNDGCLKLSKKYDELEIKTPLIDNSHAVVIRKILSKQGIWKIKGQRLCFDEAKEFTKNLKDDTVFATEGLESKNEYKLSEFYIGDNEHSFFHNIPNRQTDTFEGRKIEINTLSEWMDDEDSRYCLVFGDGGYGKTTLVLEFLNMIIDGKCDFKNIPHIVSYYSAKMTRWTEDGITHFKSMAPAMDECVRELMRLFYPTLGKDWYTVNGKQLVSKAVNELKHNDYTRNDVLLILDNTETLATTAHEVKDLGSFFKEIGRRIGRVIITSRRREFIEATPIAIEGLSEAEGVNLMKRLAEEYGALPIIQAGERTLRNTSRQLMHKPLLLEVLVKYISHSKNQGIEASIDNISKKTDEDLLEFLYEDAWLRMNELQKEVFLTIIHLASPLDQYSISEACRIVGIQHSEFQASLSETHFATQTDNGKTYSIELVELAKRFFEQQFSRLRNVEKEKVKRDASGIDSYVSERMRIESEYKKDRVAEAFRNEYAKAAKVHADKNQIKESIEMYQLAIEDDPTNSALHDRFSWLLLNKTSEFEWAKDVSKKAVKLDRTNCDATVGLALAYYRLNKISEGDSYINIAERLGRTKSFCLLRKAIARFHYSKSLKVSEKTNILEQAKSMLSLAEKSNDNIGGYQLKTVKDIRRYQELTLKELNKLKKVRRTVVVEPRDFISKNAEV